MKSRRYFLLQGALATTGILLAKPLITLGRQESFFQQGNGTNEVTLLHTNDLHNHLEPLSYHHYKNLGGFEKTATIISRIKETHHRVVLLDAGDIFCGNVLHQEEHEKTLQAMHASGYDAVLLGNRDYEAGTEYVQQHWEGSTIPLISSNYSYKNNRLKNLHQPYKIVQKGNIRIGIVGAGINLDGLAPAHVNADVEYKEPVKEISALATMLKVEMKCQLVICLSHLGYKNKSSIDDLTLASLSQNVDIIIGGHSHTFMRTPSIILNQEQKEVIINHAGYGGMVLGNMTISFDHYGNQKAVAFNNLMVGTKDHAWVRERHIAIATG